MNIPAKLFSVIIPARNESVQIGGTVRAALEAAAYLEGCNTNSLHLRDTSAEIMVVDNLSTDGTTEIIHEFVQSHGVALVSCSRLKAPCARNFGADEAAGGILVFVDADTRIPRETLVRIRRLVQERGYAAGIFRIVSQEPGWKAWLWWTFWEYVRALPLARAKAFPAFMFCTAEVFEKYGPFDEEIAIGEEWPITAGLYKADPRRFIYDRSITAFSSSRRMDMQRFGYLKSLLKYLWAILHKSGRTELTDSIRQRRGDVE